MNETFEKQSMDIRRYATERQWRGLEIGVRHFAKFAPKLASDVKDLIPSAISAMNYLAEVIYDDAQSREKIKAAYSQFDTLNNYLDSRFDGKHFINKTRQSIDQMIRALGSLENTTPLRKESSKTRSYQDSTINYEYMHPVDENMMRIRG
jgi:hypothetical protein